MKTTRQRHHIVPRHDGGTDDESNLTPPISMRLHAAFHYDRWKALRQLDDYCAWRGLVGLMSTATAKWIIGIEKRRKTVTGRRHTPERRARIAAALIGHTHSPETRAKISATKKGTKHTPEARAKISEAQIGRRLSDETRAKISAALKGRSAPWAKGATPWNKGARKLRGNDGARC